MLALVTLAVAAVGDEPSKLPFYLLGGVLALFGFALGAVGISRHATFPPSDGALRGLIALAVVLVAGAMATAVLTA